MEKVMFERQGYQFSFTIVAALVLLFLGQALDGDAKIWLYLGLLFAIAHHTYVWLIWRLELIHKWVSKTFGGNGFSLYVIGFFILFASRLITTIMLAYYDQNSVQISAILWWCLILITSILSGYTFYSVIKYFGMKRATGADHFFDEYKSMPFVKKGMFRFANNSMYTYGTLIILLPGIIAESYFAIALGVFNYVYAWVHYFCLEKPDIKRIYGESPK
jgi:hypothetical protein